MKTIEKSRLFNEIEASLANRGGPLWFPEIHPQLTRSAWASLLHDAELTPHNYGTARVLARNPTAPRTVIATLSIPQTANASESPVLIEFLNESTTRRYEELGLTFTAIDEIANTCRPECLREAFAILNQIPTLRNAVLMVVKVVHILQAQGDEYDVSHSDPVAPFSIFVSVPRSQSTSNSLRVAESILHEAMHLQLTLIETVVPLVHPSDERFWSPWKKSNRPLGGILHGMYVFLVIDAFFKNLIYRNVGDANFKHYVTTRREQIDIEIRMLSRFHDSPALTRTGRDFATRLFENFSTSR